MYNEIVLNVKEDYIMNKIFKLLSIGILSIGSLVSCGEGNKSNNASTNNTTDKTTESTKVLNGTITTNKAGIIVDGLNKTVDLKSNLILTGNITNDDVKVNFNSTFNDNSIGEITNGGTFTSKKYGTTYVSCSVTKDSSSISITKGSFKVNVIKSSAIVNKYTASAFSDDKYVMSLECKADNKFTFTRPAGTINEGDNGESINVEEATLSGTYTFDVSSIGSTMVKFTLDDASKEKGTDFEMKFDTDKNEDDILLAGKYPIAKGKLSHEGCEFSIPSSTNKE